MLKGLAIGFAIALIVFTALTGWQARGEVAHIETRRADLAQAVDGVKLTMQTRVIDMQREAGLALDLDAAQEFVKRVTQPKADLNDALDRLVNWRACAAEPKACAKLRDALPGSRHELWLLQKKHAALRTDLEKIDAELERARRHMVW